MYDLGQNSFRQKVPAWSSYVDFQLSDSLKQDVLVSVGLEFRLKKKNQLADSIRSCLCFV